jgi:hypothetical protein
MSFKTFVRWSLNPRGINALEDEGFYPFNNCVALFLIRSIWKQVTSIGAHLRWTHFHNVRQAFTFAMPPKKTTTPGAALQPLDTNQEKLSLREARSQKKKATSPTPQEEELDQEIRDLEAIHQQV